MGGGAGTVSPTGGWLQGGGESASGIDRQVGFGVDHVLEIEMVLACGEHVKFGPTEWESRNGRVHPQTTKVGGKCNSNVSPYEWQWVWGECATDVPFEDLWFAMRGGGGGTYGVVTAVTQQLFRITESHSWVTPDIVTPGVMSSLTEIIEGFGKARFNKMLIDLLIDFLWHPAALGVSEEHSQGCGHGSLTLGPTIQQPNNGFSGLYCTNTSAQVIWC